MSYGQNGVTVFSPNPVTGRVDTIERYATLKDAVEDLRDLWNEEERGEQTFWAVDDPTGRLLATLTRPDPSDPELCLTTAYEPWGSGVVKSTHRCRYLQDGAGHYFKTEVVLLDTAMIG